MCEDDWKGVSGRSRASSATAAWWVSVVGVVGIDEGGKRGFHRERRDPPISQGVTTKRNRRSRCRAVKLTIIFIFFQHDALPLLGQDGRCSSVPARCLRMKVVVGFERLFYQYKIHKKTPAGLECKLP